MTSDRTILIAGVTGNQGGAFVQALQGTAFHLRGLTQMPEGERAAALARQGVEVVKGDLDDGGDAAPCIGRRVGRLRRAEDVGGGRRAGRGARQASCDAGARGRRQTLRLECASAEHIEADPGGWLSLQDIERRVPA